MASTSVQEIVVEPVIQTSSASNLEKIESFINTSEYREIIESSSSYNNRLCADRRMRIPWLDSQTGVAQNHSALLMARRQRMPPLAPGQIYTYPRARWRKKRRQYLIINSRMLSRATDLLDGEGDLHSISQMENPALQDTDSKDSQLKDEKDWYYDDSDMLELDGYDEPDADSDFDYEESYTKRRKRGRGYKRGLDSPSTPRRGKGAGRGRKRSMYNFDPTPGDTDKPFACDLCSARYKTRPGLTYHYTHSHRDPPNSDENSRDSPSLRVHTPNQVPSPQPPVNAPLLPSVLPSTSTMSSMGGPGQSHQGGPDANSTSSTSSNSVYQDSYVTFLNHPTSGTPPSGGRGRGRQPNNPSMHILSGNQAPPSLPPNPPISASTSSNPDDPPMPVLLPERKIGPPNTSDSNSNHSVGSNSNPGLPSERIKTPDSGSNSNSAQTSAGSIVADPATSGKEKAAPSPYCDFCLGDAKENKKTGTSEELVSCSDCGRSGHPTCLQFTANMIISVRKYRWQCIECKCCSICGTSDNDDQLLFCDDCDRGYHMYCLNPPLSSPPEGSWSCRLCIAEFHK